MSEQAQGHLAEERIREILEEYRVAYERGDRAALLDFFADDAVIRTGRSSTPGR